MTATWYRVAEKDELPIGQVMTTLAGIKAVCLIHTEEHGFTAVDNRCPHQGGPLGEGQLDGPWLICPWHGYEYDPETGEPPEGYGDCAIPMAVDVREDGIYVQVEDEVHQPTISDQMVGCGFGLWHCGSQQLGLWRCPTPGRGRGALALSRAIGLESLSGLAAAELNSPAGILEIEWQ